MKWTITILLIIIGALSIYSANKQRRMKVCIDSFQRSYSASGRAYFINQGREIMCTELLPYVLESYRDERDIQFTAAMIGKCRSKADNEILLETARTSPPGEQIRIVCMTQLLNRGHFHVWEEITEDDINMIALSMPVHIVHWRQLMLQYRGRPAYVLRRDTYPERHRFKALLRDCIEKYKAQEPLKLIPQAAAIPPDTRKLENLYSPHNLTPQPVPAAV
jgi:hypothetical protein